MDVAELAVEELALVEVDSPPEVEPVLALVLVVSADVVDSVELELPVAAEAVVEETWVEAQETAVGTVTPAVSQIWSAKTIVANWRLERWQNGRLLRVTYHFDPQASMSG